MNGADRIADWFLCSIDRGAGDSLTHLKLQKLLYYAQAWSLALEGEPLFAEDFQAWAHGPVLVSQWNRFKGFGWESLPAPPQAPGLDEPTESLLADVLKAYGEHSAKALEDLTHSEEPWIRARGGLPPEARCTAVIPKSHMRRFYARLYAELGGDGEEE